MKDSKTLINVTLASIVALGMSGVAGHAQAKEGFEKCGGIVKTGMNDCGTAKHGCSSMSKEDGVADEWIYVPEGTCAKIVGATLVEAAPRKQ